MTCSDDLINHVIKKNSKSAITMATVMYTSGRYLDIPRHARVCSTCTNEGEDENHVLFHCTRYDVIPTDFIHLVNRYNFVQKMLNPSNVKDANDIGSLLLKIEDCRQKL